jgi:hypothetical protein
MVAVHCRHSLEGNKTSLATKAKKQGYAAGQHSEDVERWQYEMMVSESRRRCATKTASWAVLNGQRSMRAATEAGVLLQFYRGG